MKFRMGFIYGLGGGLLLGLVQFALYYANIRFDYSTQEKLGYSSMLLSLLFMVPAMLAIKRHQQGVLSLRQAWAVGLAATLGAALAYSAGAALLFMDPDYVAHFKELSSEHFEATNPAMAQEMEQQASFLSPGVVFFVIFATVFFMGLLVTAVSSFIVKKEAPAAA